MEGRLWIHAASKVPDEATINAMEEFYRQIYALDGITDLKFPEHYPVSRLLGNMRPSSSTISRERQINIVLMHHVVLNRFERMFDVGCVEVVGCLRREELARWTAVAEGVDRQAYLVFLFKFMVYLFHVVILFNFV